MDSHFSFGCNNNNKRKRRRHFLSSDTDESAVIDISVDKRSLSLKDDNDRRCWLVKMNLPVNICL